MRISIITVCLNNRTTIRDTIDSVLAQSHTDLEYLIIDGGSGDGTLEIVEQYRQHVAKIVSEPDAGIYDAMNKGIALATGDLIGMLNADDTYADNAVLADVAAIFSDPAVDACYGDLVYVASRNPEQVVRYWRAGELDLKRLYQGWVPPHPSFFLRTEAYRQYGGYLASFRLAGDYELLLRMLLRHTLGCAYIPRVLVRMRTGGASNRNLGNIIAANREAWRAWSINGLAITPWQFLRKPISKIRQYFTRPCS